MTSGAAEVTPSEPLNVWRDTASLPSSNLVAFLQLRKPELVHTISGSGQAVSQPELSASARKLGECRPSKQCTVSAENIGRFRVERDGDVSFQAAALNDQLLNAVQQGRVEDV